jgi:hypothetical protein
MSRNAIVAGTGFEHRAEIIRRYCREGMIVFLERDPNNKFDENAIAVYLAIPIFFGLLGINRKQIGFIKANTAESLSKRLDAGEKIEAKVKSYWAPKGKNHPRVTLELNI